MLVAAQGVASPFGLFGARRQCLVRLHSADSKKPDRRPKVRAIFADS